MTRKIVLVIFVLVVFGMGVAIGAFCFANRKPAGDGANNPHSIIAEESKAPPGMALSPARHDFGHMREGEYREIKLALKHPGKSRLRLGRIYSPCPCITFAPDKRVFEPGEEASVTVQVHSLTLEGKSTFPIYVEVTEPAKGVLRADVDVTVQRVPAQLRLEPEALHLGSVGTRNTATATLTNLTKRPMRIINFTSAIPGARVNLLGGSMIEPGKAVKVGITVAGDKLKAGPIRGSVTLKTNLPLHSVVEIPVDGTVRG